MSFLTGKPAKNVNNKLITGTETSQVQEGTNADNNLSALLQGTGDVASANKNYQNYLAQAGYGAAMTNLSKNVTGQGAASGLLNSGATTKALASDGAQLNNQFYNNYLSQLSGLTSIGQGAAANIAGVGQQGATTSPFQAIAGIAKGVGQTAAAFS